MTHFDQELHCHSLLHTNPVLPPPPPPPPPLKELPPLACGDADRFAAWPLIVVESSVGEVVESSVGEVVETIG